MRDSDNRRSVFWRDPHETPETPTDLPGDAPLNSELALWLYIGKGLVLLFIGAFILINLSYGFWELLDLMGG